MLLPLSDIREEGRKTLHSSAHFSRHGLSVAAKGEGNGGAKVHLIIPVHTILHRPRHAMYTMVRQHEHPAYSMAQSFTTPFLPAPGAACQVKPINKEISSSPPSAGGGGGSYGQARRI